MDRKKFGALAFGAMLVAAACTPTGGESAAPSSGGETTAPSAGGGESPAPGSAGTLKIGIDLPLSGGEAVNGEPTRNGVLLAIKQANAAGGINGYTLEAVEKDDAVNGVHDPNQGATNVNALVADEAVVGMVGPFNSNVARAQIPIANEAGLAMCSPANTGVDRTQEGSETYRPANPDARNYFRTATPDNIQGKGLAQYAYNELGAKNAYVLDDTEAFGVGVANEFEKEFVSLGGTIAKRDGNDYKTNTSFTSLLTTAKGLTPPIDVVFFGGTQTNGGGQVRKDMGSLAMLDIPYVGPDGITDLAKGGTKGAYITLAGVENSGNTHGSVAGVHDLPNAGTFPADYEAEFGTPPGAYSALAFVCTTILLDSIRTATAAGGTDMAALREAVRAAAFDGSTHETLVGPIVVDPNGDSGTWLSFYKTDPTAEGGLGGWTFVKQQNFAPGQ
ncbi:MAG: branched-chain amino acid ABC transporter substrate-binding protein [Candidatus Limnocylindrales bacterium]